MADSLLEVRKAAMEVMMAMSQQMIHDDSLSHWEDDDEAMLLSHSIEKSARFHVQRVSMHTELLLRL